MIKNAIILVLAIAVCLLTFLLISDRQVGPTELPNNVTVDPSESNNPIESTEPTDSVDPVIKDLEKIESITDKFGSQLEGMGISKDAIADAIEDIQEYNKTAEYAVAVEIQNIKVPLIKTTLHLPVDDAAYNSVEIGEVLTKEQLASLNVPEEYLTGWKVTIIDKIVKDAEKE